MTDDLFWLNANIPDAAPVLRFVKGSALTGKRFSAARLFTLGGIQKGLEELTV